MVMKAIAISDGPYSGKSKGPEWATSAPHLKIARNPYLTLTRHNAAG